MIMTVFSSTKVKLVLPSHGVTSYHLRCVDVRVSWMFYDEKHVQLICEAKNYE